MQFQYFMFITNKDHSLIIYFLFWSMIFCHLSDFYDFKHEPWTILKPHLNSMINNPKSSTKIELKEILIVCDQGYKVDGKWLSNQSTINRAI